MNTDCSWTPPVSGDIFTSRHGVVNELVSFVPDVTINCNPPYVKGKPDCTWVKYPEGQRPTTKNGWEKSLGMKLQTMKGGNIECFDFTTSKTASGALLAT